MAPPVPPDLSKLTVLQLKALCRERRITGYSKLSKAALLQKLAEVAPPTKAITPANDQTNSNATAAPAIAPAEDTPAYTELSAIDHRGNVRPVLVTTKSTETSTADSEAPLPTEPSQSSRNHTATSPVSISTQKPPSTKRPAHTDTSGPAKRSRTTIKSTTATASHESPVPRTTTLQKNLPADCSAFKVPSVPAQRKRSFFGNAPTLAKQIPANGKFSAIIPRQITPGPGRFKPLVVSGLKSAEAYQVDKEPSQTPSIPRDSAPLPSYHTMSLSALSHISFPPKASERKWAYRWAIVLSALSSTDRQTCMVVSRTFRYAVYLSAVHILSRTYPGRRLNIVLGQHTRNMTNFWPYLRLRNAEVFERQHAFRQSFLGRYMDSMGYDPLSKRLWTSPDDEKQVNVAIRFTLTRMWFAVSVGAYGHDASAWSRCVVRDVREVVKGEIWQVIARDSGTGESCSFYVLEATCEVVGQSPSSQGQNTLGYCLRADWTAWISGRAISDAGPGSLMECVKWSNTEDYHRGISKVWSHRVQGQDADSVSKRNVAERYILASVVANGISGQWMSTSAMAQEFAGLPYKDLHGSRTVGRPVNTVNMYLPAHHHIESVHFTTSKGDALHSAIAVVQTPGREYYVLRDNGMQVGCEEEGIPEVWRRILGCDAVGRAY